MNYRLTKSTFNYFFILLCVIWSPFQIYYFKLDGAGRILLLLSILSIFLNFNNLLSARRLFSSLAVKCWSVLTAFSLLNVICKGIITDHTTISFLNFNFVMPYIFFMVSLLELYKDKDTYIKFLFFSILLYLIMAVPHITFNQYGRSLSDELGNMVPVLSVGLFYIVSILKYNNKLRGGWTVYVVLSIILLSIIVLSGTRKALGGYVIVLVGFILSNIRQFNFKTLFGIISIALIVYWGFIWILDNTFMGERFIEESEKYNVHLVSNTYLNDFLVSLLGDRAIQYDYALDLFAQHPIGGIGLNHFSTEAHYAYRLHTEYMVQLCENGLVGFLLLMTFYASIFSGFYKIKKRGTKVTIYMFGLYLVLFLNLTSWTYNVPMIMAIYAISVYNSVQYKIS